MLRSLLPCLLLVGCVAEDDGPPIRDHQPDAGTSSEPDPAYLPDPARELCDGSSRLRFAFSGGGGLPSGTVLRAELGKRFIFVDGKCHYWISDSGHVDSLDTRQGQLSSPEYTSLVRRSQYKSWPAMAASPPDCQPSPPVSDGDSYGMRDGTYAFGWLRCENELPYVFTTFVPGLFELADSLYLHGLPMDGPVKIQLMPAGESAVAGFDWPLARDPGMLLGATVVFDNLAEARALRSIMSAYRATGDSFMPSVRAADGTVYYMDLRDVLPFESAADPYESY
jgi:hypothetical protein